MVSPTCTDANNYTAYPKLKYEQNYSAKLYCLVPKAPLRQLNQADQPWNAPNMRVDRETKKKVISYRSAKAIRRIETFEKKSQQALA